MKTYYKVTGGCVLCLSCIYECPVRAITVNANESANIDKEKCIGCGSCYKQCQAEAIVKVEEK